jgi:hypothetical protein
VQAKQAGDSGYASAAPLTTEKHEIAWDVFISHASEDTDEVARPLADILSRAGLRVWLDENELNIGDSLRRNIDDGLAHSRYGIVILSPAFFAKDWPNRELNGLAAREAQDNGTILPVWHRINQSAVAQHSPLLADRIAVSTDKGIEQVALAILKVLRPIDGEPSLRTADDEARSLFAHPSPWIGQPIADYKLLEEIGRGGSGIVFRALKHSSGYQIALKLFYPLGESLAPFYRSFERAYHAVAAVSHPNIARVLDFGQVNLGKSLACYMALEYVRGQALDLWCRSIRNVPDSFKYRLSAAVQVAEALNAAHETVYTDDLGFETRGVLHGDLKPANVLVSDNDQIKVLDFQLVDIQRLLDPQVVPAAYTVRRGFERPMTGAFGTPGFMAPEQEDGGLITVATDIFGLGVTLSYLFKREGNVAWQAALCDKDIPERLRDLLRWMVDPRAGARPKSTGIVLAELQGVYDLLFGRTRRWKILERLRVQRS